MLTLKELQHTIQQQITTQILEAAQQPRELYEPVEYILSIGGKRIRPALLLMGCNMFSDNVEPAIAPALGIEIFHNFTLLHDDIMDKSAMRRNQPTVHTKWDENTAILSGDAMSILAYQYMAQCPAGHLSQVLRIFSRTAMQVCEGQQYDMNFETTGNVSEAAYLKMIELKTSVLLAGSLKIGAVIGNAPEIDADSLYDFGRNIGLAFQLQDDYLDVFGDSRVFGKPIGNDIVANKKTFLLIKALELAEGNIQTELQRWLQDNPASHEEKIAAVTAIYRQLGVEKLSREKMLHYHAQAMQALNKVNVPNDKKIELQQFAGQLINRVH